MYSQNNTVLIPAGGGAVVDVSATGSYNVYGITYDANGNIKELNRNKNMESGSNAMDKFTYNYIAGKNQLSNVDDAVMVATGANDLKDQGVNNYIYNSIGQLTENASEGVKYFYNASGLVTEVQKNIIPLVKFFYNDKGQRVRKETYNTSGTKTNTEYYVRDAAGSVLAIYSGTAQKELPIYGASRLGVFFKVSNSSVYQLTDHLGNVRAVIAKDTQNNAIASTATDYYPFGMPMPGRQIVGGELYRYAFQGQEKDPETSKEAFQLRLWDGRIGRWLSPDPYGQYSSPYLGMGNNPISRVDPDGGEDGPGNPPKSWFGMLFSYFTGFGKGMDELSNGTGQTDYSTEEIEMRDLEKLSEGIDGFNSSTRIQLKEVVISATIKTSDITRITIINPYIRNISKIGNPIISQFNVVINEGFHPGKPYNWNNYLFNNYREFDGNWNYVKKPLRETTGDFNLAKETISDAIDVLPFGITTGKGVLIDFATENVVKETVKSGVNNIHN